MDLNGMKYFEELILERDKLRKEVKALEELTDIPDEKTRKGYEQCIRDQQVAVDHLAGIAERLTVSLGGTVSELEGLQKMATEAGAHNLFLKAGQVIDRLVSSLDALNAERV